MFLGQLALGRQQFLAPRGQRLFQRGLAGAGLLGRWMAGRQAEALAKEAEPVAPKAEADAEATWDDLVPVDELALEVGYRLIPLVDRRQDGELLRRVRALTGIIACP